MSVTVPKGGLSKEILHAIETANKEFLCNELKRLKYSDPLRKAVVYQYQSRHGGRDFGNVGS